MARSTPARSTDSARDAVALLKADHRTVEQLFDEFEEADDEQLDALARRICQLLTVHAQIEEEILYPQAREAFEDEEEAELVSEAEVEHTSAKELIAKIEAMTSEDESFKASVKVLGEYVKHHVKEEETEMFPKLKKTEVDLKDIGERLAQRKLQLMEEMGIEEEAQEQQPAPRKRATRAAKSSSRARQARGGARRSSSRGGSGRSARH